MTDATMGAGFLFGLAIGLIGIVASAIWVKMDAEKLRIPITKNQPYSLNNGAWAWFGSCLVLWIAAFPYYLMRRSDMLRAQTTQTAASTVPSTPLVPTPLGPSLNKPPARRLEAFPTPPVPPTPASSGVRVPTPGSHCSGCGTRVVAGAGFCHACGAPITPPPE